MPRAARKPGPLRKSSVTGDDREPAVVRSPSITDSVTSPHEGAIRDESPTTPVTSIPDRAIEVGDESVTASQPKPQDGGASGQGVVTGPVSHEPAEAHTLAAGFSPRDQEVVTKGVLTALLEELTTAQPEQVDALRRRLLLPPAVTLPERRRGHRKTFAWYIDEALGTAVQEKAQAEGVPPSEVVERILRQARALGWL